MAERGATRDHVFTFFLIRMMGIIGIFMVATVLVMGCKERECTEPPGGWPGGFYGPIAVIEFAKRGEVIETVLMRSEKKNVDLIREATQWDYAFIASYAVLYLLASVLIGRRSSPLALYLAFVAAACGLGAVVFDLMENHRILNALNSTETTDDMARSIREAAFVKWTLTEITIALLAMAFYIQRNWIRRIGYLFSASAFIGFVALWQQHFIRPSLLVLFVGLLLLIILSIRHPAWFLESNKN